MPFLMKLYIPFFALVVVMNIIYSAKLKVKLWTLIYELFSGPFLIFLTLAYWVDSIKSLASVYMTLPFAALIIFDFYYTIWGRPEELSEQLHGVNTKELEIAKAMSIAFTAPAYICSALLCAELIKELY